MSAFHCGAYLNLRRHPTAHRIAADMLACGVMDLRTRRLQADILQRYGVGVCTARTAVAIARRLHTGMGIPVEPMQAAA
jgi:hypothetical protein